MYGILLTLHILVSVLLAISILLQAGKGSDLGAVFGGSGSQALFGTAGPMDFIKKATIVLVVLFMINSLLLGYVVKARPSTSVMNASSKAKATQAAPATAPARQPVAPAAPATSSQQAKPVQPAAPQQAPSPSK
jgi:preprotein translocase subunit SecG